MEKIDPMREHLAIALDKDIHQKTRLALLSILMIKKEAEFNYFKEKLKLSDGNLSTHLSHLEKAGYIEIRKEFVKKRPKTTCRLTEKGRRAFSEYLSDLEQIIRVIPKD